MAIDFQSPLKGKRTISHDVVHAQLSPICSLLASLTFQKTDTEEDCLGVQTKGAESLPLS